jgi:hypothetical protein
MLGLEGLDLGVNLAGLLRRLVREGLDGLEIL